MPQRVKQKNRDRAVQRRGAPTIPDLVILSLLAERAMHGYEVNAILEQRRIREWAPVSRPQIYYSLDKLVNLGLIHVVKDKARPAGPERTVFETTPNGLECLADSLEEQHWVDDRVYQPFLIWLALSWKARGDTFMKQLEKRLDILSKRLTDERATLASVLSEVGHGHHEAVWMLELKTEQTQLEMRWVERLMATAVKRKPALRRKYP